MLIDATLAPIPDPTVGQVYSVAYSNHKGTFVPIRKLKYLGRRLSSAAKRYYPDAPGIEVPMMDWEEVPEKIGAYGVLTRLSFRAADLFSYTPEGQ